MNEILAITRCTIKELARSYHYKLLFIFYSLLLQFSFWLAALYQAYFTIRSPNLGYNGTQFLVGNVDSTHFFLLQFVVVALTLVYFERMCGRGVLETIHVKRYRNISWTIGTLLGISALVFAIPLVNLIVIYGASLQGEILGLDFGPAPEPLSFLNLILVDVPTTIVFYCAVALLFSQIRPNKMLIGAATLAVAFIHLVLIQTVPFNWRELVSYSTTNSLLVSEVLPYFSTGWVLFNRLDWTVLAVGLLVAASLLNGRRDRFRRRYMQVAMTCVGLAIAGLFVHGFAIHREDYEKQSIAATHRYSPLQVLLDLTNISGQVVVDPGIRVLIDVDLAVKKLGEQSLDSLQFSLNPGMDLHQVRVDGQERKHSFSHGLINIPLTGVESSKDTWIVSIRGSGVPDESFGYPYPERDYLRQSGASLQLPKLLGAKNSIFDRRFVALMPGSRWYPTPLPLGIDRAIQSMQLPVDTYSVDLDILIANENWKLAAPERTVIKSEDSVHYKIRSEGEVPHFAIVASEFQSHISQANGVEVELLIHDTHFQPTESMNAVWNSMVSFISERLSELSETGLQFPYRTLTFVEVPNHLRLAGGYDMPLLYSQPGLVFIRESGIPTAKWDQKYQWYLNSNMSKSEVQPLLAEDFFFYDYTNILGGNLLSSVAEQYFPFIDSPLGWEGLVLNHMKRMLINDIMMGPEDYNASPSDISLIEEIADLTAIYPSLVLARMFRVFGRLDPTRLEWQLYERFMLNDASFTVHSQTMSNLLQSEDVSLRRTAIELRLSDTYRALKELYGDKRLKTLLELETLRILEHSNSSFDIGASGFNGSSSSLIPILSEWNDSTEAPAFSFSELNVVQVAVEDTPYKYRASFKIRNDADVTGVVKFYTDHYHETLDTGICVEIPRLTAYKVNLYTEQEIYVVVISTYYSENQGVISLEPRETIDDEALDVTIENEIPSITEISWRPHDENTVIVDNLDSGFRLVDWEGRRDSILFDEVHWPWDPPPLPSIRAKGLETFDWSKLRANRTWMIISDPWSDTYGRYRPTALATQGTNVEVARFSANLPVQGRWTLSYYFPDNFAFRGRFGVHNFVLHDSNSESHFQADPKDGGGWIHAGEFDISDSTIHLDLVSVDPPNSLRVADAIRWELVAADKN